MYPFLSFFTSYCCSLFQASLQFFRRHSSTPQLRKTACISLHACAGLTNPPPRAFPGQPTARRVSLPPNLPIARPSHDQTPQRPIAHANSYTTLVIPRDVPSNHHRRHNRSRAGLRICDWRPALPGREIARVALLAATKVLLCSLRRDL